MAGFPEVDTLQARDSFSVNHRRDRPRVQCRVFISLFELDIGAFRVSYAAREFFNMMRPVVVEIICEMLAEVVFEGDREYDWWNTCKEFQGFELSLKTNCYRQIEADQKAIT